MKITALKLKDRHFDNWYSEVEDQWDYTDFLKDEAWRKDWISFDCCLYVQEQSRVYCGITSFDADIFYAYDRESGEFIDCGFGAVKDPYDAKFHRSLVRWDKDGCLYAAIALLHDIDRWHQAPGSAIVKYDPAAGTIEKLGIPLPHVYIQSICLDQEQGFIYGQTFTPERMVQYDINTSRSRDLGPIGSGIAMAQGENIELDNNNCAWCGWNVTRAWQSQSGVDSHRLCKYNTDTGKIDYFNTGLPQPDGSHGYVKVEGIFNLRRDCLYASGGNGSLYRIDVETGRAVYLDTPVTDRPSRLSSLRLGPDGVAYGVTGRQGKCEVIRFDPETEKYKLLGPVKDKDEACWQVHDVAVTPEGVIYACENDNPYRSGYLWEVCL